MTIHSSRSDSLLFQTDPLLLDPHSILYLTMSHVPHSMVFPLYPVVPSCSHGLSLHVVSLKVVVEGKGTRVRISEKGRDPFLEFDKRDREFYTGFKVVIKFR